MDIKDQGKKVLFLYASLNSGHQKAAQAIREALLLQISDVETMDIEALKFSYPNLGRLVHKIYMIMATNMSRFYDFLWDNVSIERRIVRLKKIINKNSLDKFEELFNKFTAKVAVCTQALPCGFLSTLKQERNFHFKLIAVITDYDVHTYWIYEGVDIYCVATSDMKEKLIHRGVSEDKIKVIGIPVRLQFTSLENELHRTESILAEDRPQTEFSRRRDPALLRDTFGIRKDLPCLLIMGGSYGVGPLIKIIMSLNKVKDDFTIIVVVGKNDRLYKNLQKKLKKIKKPIKLFRYVEDVAQLMRVSDILITKPGGLTTSEALCIGLPMIITRGVMGQESGNFKYLLDNGVAVGAEGPSEVAVRFEELIDNRSYLKTMRENALKIAKPEAAKQISQLIGSFL